MASDALFTPAARKHILGLARELEAHAPKLERRFRAALQKQGVSPDAADSLLAIVPGKPAPSVTFWAQVLHHGKLLAKRNIALEQAVSLLRRYDLLADKALSGRFAPAREQLILATIHQLHLAFYEVREAETQAFFGTYRAETEALGLEDLLRRLVGVLTRAFEARAGRLFLSPDRAPRTREDPAPDLVRGDACCWQHPLGSTGLIQLSFHAPRPCLPREKSLLEAVAARCEQAIDRSRRECAIRRLQSEARRAEEDERRRIGRELHDEAGQSLLLLRLRLEMMAREAPAELQPKVAEARALAESTIVEVRRIISALGPAVLERLGLAPALRQLAARFRKSGSAELRLRIALKGASLPGPAQEVIYRVAQECLGNAAKHSGAAHINVSLRASDRGIRLSVSDDGAGFQAETARLKPTSFGLTGMQERAALLDGTLTVRSAPSNGTTVTLNLPLQPAPLNQTEDTNVENSRTPHR